MSWIRATPRKKCPVCNGSSWCCWKDTETGKYVLCMRESLNAIKSSIIAGSSSTAYHHQIEDGFVSSYKSYNNIEIVKNDIAPVAKRDVIYKDLFTGYLTPLHRKYLNIRGFNNQQIPRYYTSVPRYNQRKEICEGLVLKHGSLKGIPGFWETSDGERRLAATQGIFLPVINQYGEITGAQIATDRSILSYIRFKQRGLEIPKQEEPSKYVWFSAAPFEDKNKDTGRKFLRRKTGVGASAEPHFSGKFNPNECIITEGVLKADLINTYMNKLVIATPGVGIGSTKVAQAVIGIEKIVMAYDMDIYENQHVMNALVGLIKLIEQKRGLDNVWIAEWDKKYKGLDDLILDKKDEIRYIKIEEWLKIYVR